jgi:hypothetical protein
MKRKLRVAHVLTGIIVSACIGCSFAGVAQASSVKKETNGQVTTQETKKESKKQSRTNFCVCIR